MPSTYQEKLQACAERMRRNPTPSELVFKERLEAIRVPFVFQKVIGRYIVDFVLPHRMLVFEIDGGIHGTPRKILYDKRRTEFLKELGFRVRRIPNAQVATYPLRKFRHDHKTPRGHKRYDRAIRTARVVIKQRSEAFAQRQEIKALDRAAKAVKPMTARLIKHRNVS